MRMLTDLNPSWYGLARTPEHGEGISFDCPVCGPTHHIVAFFDNPLDGQPLVEWQNPRWKRTGEDFRTLTVHPSIQYPCFHGWVEQGKVFLMQETPLTIVATVNGETKAINLSPTQCLELLPQVMARAKEMLASEEPA